MIPVASEVTSEQLSGDIRSWLRQNKKRLGFISSIDGSQLVSLLLDQNDGSAQIWTTPLKDCSYPSLTISIPEAHWYERELSDMFGLTPVGHPRLKAAILNEAYRGPRAPLRTLPSGNNSNRETDLGYLHVTGEGIFELPVGPVHAGIIEPGHFRLSCLGETVINLEVRLGFVHRGVEKRLAEVPWHKARFVAEAAAGDTQAANALAHAMAIESLFELTLPMRAQNLRTIAMEVERLAMHIIDVSGMALDLGFISVAAALSRLRGTALNLAEILSGSRFLRGFILPGGVSRDPDLYLRKFRAAIRKLRLDLRPILRIFTENPTVYDRLRGTGTLSTSLAADFAMVGIAARASNIPYDVRLSFPHEAYPMLNLSAAVERHGDALSRTLVRVAEIRSSLDLIDQLLESLPTGPIHSQLPDGLPSGKVGLGIVEAFRGELIHLIFTDGNGNIRRYAIKDPSFNNWTGLAIAVRNNVIADFPICNKSFGLSYSGHDL